MNNTLPPPSAFGLNPDQFPGWRVDQERAILEQYDCPKRFLIQVLPTGAGKSLPYITSGLLHSGRTLYLTSTKGLMEQLQDDFSDKLVTIMGKNNYKCRLDPTNELTCDLGPCRANVYCQYKDRGCPYWDQVRRAAKSNMVSTNYAYWLMNRPRGGKEAKYSIGNFDMLVCDEAHDSVNNLLGTLSTTITAKECPIPWIEEGAELKSHREWLDTIAEYCKDKIENKTNGMSTYEAKQLGKLISLKSKADMILNSLNSANWVIDWTLDKVKYDPIWPSYLSEPWLFRGIKKVIMTSATIRPKTLNILGVKGNGNPDNEESEFICTEYPNHFPIARRPIYYIPTARIDYKSTIDEINYWLMRHDQIIRPRLDRKGIIHAVSYDRCQKITSTSAYRQYFKIHNSYNTRRVVKEFKESQPPSILVSPSITTGYDFPYESARYQILCKIPFPDQRSKVDQERKKIDKTYGSYCAMQQVQQACGRSNRAGDDFSETFILDDHAKWFFYKEPTKGFAAQWFLDALIWTDVLPQPPSISEMGRRK